MQPQTLLAAITIAAVTGGLWLANLNDSMSAELAQLRKENAALIAKNEVLLYQLSNDK